MFFFRGIKLSKVIFVRYWVYCLGYKKNSEKVNLIKGRERFRVVFNIGGYDIFLNWIEVSL